MKKKLFSMILVFIFVLAGCASDDAAEAVSVMTDAVETGEIQKVGKSERIVTLPEREEVQKATEELEEPEEPEESQESEAQQESEAIEESLEEDKAGQSQQESVSIHNEQISGPVSVSESEQQSALSSHTCIWDGGTVITNATCDKEGIKLFQCNGCGNTRTESIAKISHNYVTESIPATCTVAGITRISCSICGDVKSESAGVAAIGHTIGAKIYAFGEPTCTGGAYYNIQCAVCGEVMETGADPALPHKEVATVIQQGNCSENTIISYDCGVCGCPIRREAYYEDIHEWITGEADSFNMDTLEWEKVSVTYCARCKIHQ